MTNPTAITLPPLSLAATVINNHHKQIIEHGKGMLREAKAAGEELLWVKKHLKHGEFGPWVKANCGFSVEQARRYMRVAKTVDVDCFDPDASIESILQTKGKPKAHLQSFSKSDAEYAQKLHTMSLRGTEHEREVAKGKLEAFAKSFGKTGEELVKEAEEKNPEPVSQTINEIAIEKALEPFRKKTKDDLLLMLLHCMVKHPDLVPELKGAL